jgi:hypothetical protein
VSVVSTPLNGDTLLFMDLVLFNHLHFLFSLPGVLFMGFVFFFVNYFECFEDFGATVVLFDASLVTELESQAFVGGRQKFVSGRSHLLLIRLFDVELRIVLGGSVHDVSIRLRLLQLVKLFELLFDRFDDGFVDFFNVVEKLRLYIRSTD